MRIAFRADAGITQGTGHVVRSLTLAREFQDSGHEVCLVSNIEGVPWLSNMVKRSSIDWRNCSAHNSELETFVRERFDIVVVDSYEIPSGSINEFVDRLPIMTIVDNDMRGIVPRLVLDQNLGALGFDSGYRTKQLIGPNYSLVRPEIREIKRESSSWLTNQGPPRVLIMIGGTDPTKLAVKLSRMLQGLDSNYLFHFVTPEENINEIAELLPKNASNIHVLTSEIQDLLKVADLAISAAGTSSLDLSCIGIPTIYMSIARNQDANLRAISSMRIGLTLEPNTDIENQRDSLVRSIERCAYDAPLREMLFLNSQHLVDGKGSGRVVEAVTETIQGL